MQALIFTFLVIFSILGATGAVYVALDTYERPKQERPLTPSFNYQEKETIVPKPSLIPALALIPRPKPLYRIISNPKPISPVVPKTGVSILTPVSTSESATVSETTSAVIVAPTTENVSDTTGPILSSITTSNTTVDSTTISWTTNELADSQVEYGLTSSYGLQTPLDTILKTSHSVTLSSLQSYATYYYRVTSKDAVGNLSVSASDNTVTTQLLGTISNDSSVTTTTTTTTTSDTSDTQAPDAIGGLLATSVSAEAITISWVAPSDMPSAGAATSYDIRYSASDITTSSWDSAVQVTGEPTPATPGTTQSYTITGLASGTSFFVAIRSLDAAGNLSSLSNILTATTLTKPSSVTNLIASAVGVFSWSVPSDTTIKEILIFRGTGLYPTSTGTPLATLASSNTFYFDTTMLSSTTYFYSIYTRDSLGTYSIPTQISFTPSAVATALSGWSAYLSTSGNYTNSAWASTVRNSAQEAVASTQLPYVNIVAVETQGLESARQQSLVDTYMSSILADGGKVWRDGMYSRTISMVNKEAGTGHTSAWQIGNEISSIHYNDAFNTWSAANPSYKLSGDPIIPYYVEYYLAPSVEGIRRAEAELGVDIPVTLGSISEAYNPDRRVWLDSLLAYTITGTYAPTLAGKTVKDIIEILTVHYLVTVDNAWESSLDGIWSKWNNTGTIRGLWSTEEIGGKAGESGRGASSAARIFARYNKWWIKNGLDSKKGLSSFWGPELALSGNTSTTGGYALGMINDFFGGDKTGKITDFSNTLSLSGTTGIFDAYLFGNTVATKKLIFVVFPKGNVDSMTATSASFSVPGWSGATTANAHLLSTAGDGQSTPIVTGVNGVYTITFPTTLSLTASITEYPAYVVLLERL